MVLAASHNMLLRLPSPAIKPTHLLAPSSLYPRFYEMKPDDEILEQILTLIKDYHDFNPGIAQVFTAVPTAVQFCKQVGKGLPCIYPAYSLIAHHKASRWIKNDLISAVTEKVEVAMTPDGKADSLCLVPGQGEEKIFLQPANIDMTLEELFDKLESRTGPHDPVYYLQSQNGNLTSTPLAPLFKDLPLNFSFAQGVLGEPEAVNMWIGDERSVTSAHRDPYENLYVVLRGAKVFTLWPPVDEIALDAQIFRTGRYTFDETTYTFDIVLDKNEKEPDADPAMIPWVTIDPHLPREQLEQEHELYKHANPQMVVVEAGQMLYLPSGWYHHVAQRCGAWDDGSTAPCISVNYWYDQDYEGEKYVMRQLIGRLTQQLQQTKLRMK